MSADWIAVDWGTSNLRLWQMGADHSVKAERTSPQGMGGLTADQYEGVLLNLIGDLIDGPTDVIICGMAGARQGWKEAPYVNVPCIAAGAGFIEVDTNDPRLNVRILSGASQSDPADVMRGEETQIAGFLTKNPNFKGVLCLPGTHTKWVQVGGGRIKHFRTVMTGELFALLRGHSILRHSVGPDWDDASFDNAVVEETTLADLFSIRASSLVHGTSSDVLTGRLSGHLIGQEIAAMKHLWNGEPTVIIGADALSDLYKRGLTANGANATISDGGELVRLGLIDAYSRIKDRT
jgi:2-dehydro-3-deoxygalactonokinase